MLSSHKGETDDQRETEEKSQETASPSGGSPRLSVLMQIFQVCSLSPHPLFPPSLSPLPVSLPALSPQAFSVVFWSRGQLCVWSVQQEQVSWLMSRLCCVLVLSEFCVIVRTMSGMGQTLVQSTQFTAASHNSQPQRKTAGFIIMLLPLPPSPLPLFPLFYLSLFLHSFLQT